MFENQACFKSVVSVDHVDAHMCVNFSEQKIFFLLSEMANFVYNQLYMSDFVIYVPLEKHIRQWLTATLGDPVTFLAYSNENAVIRSFTIKTPPGVTPVDNRSGMVAIRLPDSSSKPPETYNHLGKKGQIALREAIKDLFMRALWSDITPLCESKVGVNKLIAAWCESKGIDIDSVETVRQCFYRLRKQYAQNGINIKKFK